MKLLDCHKMVRYGARLCFSPSAANQRTRRRRRGHLQSSSPHMATYYRVPENKSLSKINVSPNDVIKFLKKCKKGMSSGPDGIPQCFLKKFGMLLIKPLTVFYCHLVDLGAVPPCWKFSYVTPIFKKGVSSEIANYRPISLTSVFCKLLKRIIHDKMLNYLSDNQLISPHQHGFLAKHSTCTQLLETVNDWSIALLNRNVVDVMYFDFTKAFDIVSHTKLMCKLYAYGFDGELLAFIHDFITGRSQRVVLPNGHSSLHVMYINLLLLLILASQWIPTSHFLIILIILFPRPS